MANTTAGWFAALAVVPAAAAGLAVAAWASALDPWPWAVIALAVAGIALWILLTLLRDHFAGLARLREAIVGATGAAGDWAPPRLGDDAAVSALTRAVNDLVAASAAAARERDRRLAGVIAALPEAIVVVTETGLVSLVNDGARRLFSGRTLSPGSSLFDAISRDSFLAGWDDARAQGRAVDATLSVTDGRMLPARVVDFPGHRGAILILPAEAGALADLHYDLQLHDSLPAPEPVTPATPLENLPLIVLDCETTGLKVDSDRVLSIGAIRLTGTRRHRSHTLDLVVNPGVPIPPASTRIHGIDDEMVRAAPPFAAVHAQIVEFAAGCIYVGHNVGFDTAMLAGEARRAGLPWPEPLQIDTLLLVAALRPDLSDLNLESIAGWLGVTAIGRHTALGDALVTAEIWRRIVPLLAEVGVTTWGAAVEFAQRPKRVIAMQKAAGW